MGISLNLGKSLLPVHKQANLTGDMLFCCMKSAYLKKGEFELTDIIGLIGEGRSSLTDSLQVIGRLTVSAAMDAGQQHRAVAQQPMTGHFGFSKWAKALRGPAC